MGWLDRLVIHVMNAPRPSPFFIGLSLPCIYCKRSRKWERLGNEATTLGRECLMWAGCVCE